MTETPSLLPLFRNKAEALRLFIDAHRRHWLPHGSLRNRFATAVFWSFIGMFVARVFGLLASVVTARLLGLIGFGEYGIITSTLGMFGVLGGLGLGLTATKHVAELRKLAPIEAGRVAGFTLLIATVSSGLISIALFTFAPFLAATSLNAPHLSAQLRIASVYIFLAGINGVQIGILSGFEAFAAIAKVNLMRGLINLPLTFLGVKLFGLSGAIAILVILELVTITINRLFIGRVSRTMHVPILYQVDWVQLKVLWNFSLPSFLSAFLGVITVWSVNAILVNGLGGYAQMGLLSAVLQWQAVAIVVPSILSTIGVAIQSELFGNSDHRNFSKVVRYNVFLQTGGTTCVVAMLILFAPWIMRIYGKSFDSGIPALILVAIGWIVMTASSVLWDAMISSNFVWWGFLCKLLGYGVLLVGAWRLVYMGAKGVALAYLISYSCTLAAQVCFYAMRRQDRNS